jgi:hypothetical protein
LALAQARGVAVQVRRRAMFLGHPQRPSDGTRAPCLDPIGKQRLAVPDKRPRLRVVEQLVELPTPSTRSLVDERCNIGRRGVGARVRGVDGFSAFGRKACPSIEYAVVAAAGPRGSGRTRERAEWVRPLDAVTGSSPSSPSSAVAAQAS